MAITVDWVTKIINVPQADLTSVTGTLYELDTEWFKAQINDIEDSVYGIPNLRILDHNTQYTVAGVTYARKLEIINGYKLQFEDGLYSVRLTGSNNNFFDVENGILFQNSVQVIPGNSAGLIVKVEGSGVTEQDKLDIADRVWDEIINGGSHNTPSSAGKRLLQLGDAVDGSVTDPAATTKSFITNLTETSDDHYNDQLIRFTSGNLEGLVRPILDYDGATGTIIVSEPFNTPPDDGIDFYIIPSHVHPLEQIAQKVTNEILPFIYGK